MVVRADDREKESNWRRVVLGVLLFGLLVLTGACRNYIKADPIQPQIAAKILRFHVLANSDSERDQQIKLKVRDAVGAYIEPKLSDADSLSRTKQIVEAHMEGIIEAADQVLKEEGASYQAEAYLTTMEFPVKTYGEYTFPKGRYQALRVVLGNGAGHNWWCVLYPNMCFRGSVYEIVEEDAKKELREVLDEEEYADIFQKGNYQVRFKLLEKLRIKL